jgi:acyl carrier protein
MTNEERLQNVFRDVFDDESILIRRELTAKDVENWDSLSHVSMLAAVEKEFGFRFNLAEVRGLKNVGELLDLIQKKKG